MSSDRTKKPLDTHKNDQRETTRLTMTKEQAGAFYRAFWSKGKVSPWRPPGGQGTHQPIAREMAITFFYKKLEAARAEETLAAMEASDETLRYLENILDHYLSYLSKYSYKREFVDIKDKLEFIRSEWPENAANKRSKSKFIPRKNSFASAWKEWNKPKEQAVTLLTCFLVGKSVKEVHDALELELSFPPRGTATEERLEKHGLNELRELESEDKQPTHYSIYTGYTKEGKEVFAKVAHNIHGSNRIKRENSILRYLKEKSPTQQDCAFPEEIEFISDQVALYSRLKPRVSSATDTKAEYQNLAALMKSQSKNNIDARKAIYKSVFTTELDKSLMTRLLFAVQWIHKNKVGHCNLKPSKIFYRESHAPHIALVDFTRATIEDTICDCPQIDLSLEEIKIKKYTDSRFLGIDRTRDKSSDIYALGVLIGELYLCRSDLTLPQIRIHLEIAGNPDMVHLLDRCTSEEIAHRPNVDELIEISTKLLENHEQSRHALKTSLPIRKYSSRLMDIHVVSGNAHRVALALGGSPSGPEESESISKEISHFRDPEKRDVAWVFSKIGQVHLLSGDYRRALQFFEKTLEIRGSLRKTYKEIHGYLEYHPDFNTVEFRYCYTVFCAWISHQLCNVPLADSSEIGKALEELQEKVKVWTRVHPNNLVTRYFKLLAGLKDLNEYYNGPSPTKEPHKTVDSWLSSLTKDFQILYSANALLVCSHWRRLSNLHLQYSGGSTKAIEGFSKLIDETKSRLTVMRSDWKESGIFPGKNRILDDIAESRLFLADCYLGECLESDLVTERSIDFYEKALTEYGLARDRFEEGVLTIPTSLRLRRKLATVKLDLAHAHSMLSSSWPQALDCFREARHLLEIHKDDRDYNIALHYLVASVRQADLLQAILFRRTIQPEWGSAGETDSPEQLYESVLQFCQNNQTRDWGNEEKRDRLLTYFEAISFSRLADMRFQSALGNPVEVRNFGAAIEKYDQALRGFKRFLSDKPDPNHDASSDWPLDDITQVLRPRKHFLFLADFEEPPNVATFFDSKWNLESIRVEPPIHNIFFANGVAHCYAVKGYVKQAEDDKDAATELLKEAKTVLSTSIPPGAPHLPMTVLDTLFEIGWIQLFTEGGGKVPGGSVIQKLENGALRKLVRKGNIYPLFLRKLQSLSVERENALTLFFRDELLQKLPPPTL